MAVTQYLSTGPHKEGEAKAPEDRWQFQTHHNNLRTLCMAGVKHGEVTLGLIAMKGKIEYRGFVNGLIDIAKRATWRIDEGLPTVVDGRPQREHRWVTEFLRGRVPRSFTHGDELAVTSAKGDRVVVGLTEAKDVLATFNACCLDGQPATGSAEQSSREESTETARKRPDELNDSERKAAQLVGALDARYSGVRRAITLR